MNSPSLKRISRLTLKRLILFVFISKIILFHAGICRANLSFHGKPIGKVNIEAESFISAEETKWLLDFKVGETYSEKKIEEGIKLLYLKDFFSNIIVDAAEVDGKVVLTFILVPKIRITKIDFKGNDYFWKSDLRSMISLKESDELNEKRINEAKKRLIELYKEDGFLNVKIDHEVIKGKNPFEKSVVFMIDEGRHSVIRSISFDFPCVKFDESKIRKVVGIKENKRLSKKLLKTAQENLEEYLVKNSYYDLENIRFEYNENDDVDLKIIVNVPYKVRINFIGNVVYDERKLLSFFNFSKHKKSDINVIRDNFISEIISFYKSNGYYFIEIAIGKEDGKEQWKVVGDEKIINIYVHEGHRIRVMNLTFSGNNLYDRERLQNQMLTRTTGFFTNEYLVEDILIEDIKALEYLYQRSGYLDVEVTDSKLFNAGKDEVSLELKINEGNQTFISGIDYDGFNDEIFLEVKKLLKTQVGNSMNIYRLEDEKLAITGAYKEKGYYNVNVDIKSDFLPDNKVWLTYKVVEGVKARIGKLILSNNNFTKKKVIRREAGLEEGDTYSLNKILLAQQKVYRLGFFERVNIRPVTEEEVEVKDILVEVKEKDCGYGEFGIGYATEEGVRGSVEIGHKNLYGYGRVVSVRADADSDSRKYSLFFEEPWLFNNPYDATVYLVDLYSEEASYTLREFGTTLGIKKDFTETIQAILQYELEFDELIDVANEAVIIPEDVGTNRICTISPYLVRDSRDDPFNPTRGSVNSFKYDYADKIIGSELRFHRITGRSSWYLPLRRNITLGLSFRGGYGFSVGDELRLPINKRFFLGGRNTVRGFERDSIGPKGEGDVPIGGSIMTNYNAEFRMSFGKSWGGILFYDAGNVWADKNSFEATDLRDAVGVGLRYITVVGPISLDVGRKLDRKPGESLTEWYFTIGNIF